MPGRSLGFTGLCAHQIVLDEEKLEPSLTLPPSPLWNRSDLPAPGRLEHSDASELSLHSGAGGAAGHSGGRAPRSGIRIPLWDISWITAISSIHNMFIIKELQNNHGGEGGIRTLGRAL